MTRHVAATTRETFPQIGAMGYPIVVGLRGFDVPQVAAQLNVYRKAWQEDDHMGHGDVFLGILVYTVSQTSCGQCLCYGGRQDRRAWHNKRDFRQPERDLYPVVAQRHFLSGSCCPGVASAKPSLAGRAAKACGRAVGVA